MSNSEATQTTAILTQGRTQEVCLWIPRNVATDATVGTWHPLLRRLAKVGFVRGTVDTVEGIVLIFKNKNSRSQCRTIVKEMWAIGIKVCR